MKKQTAVEWLEEIYLTTGIDRNVHFNQAKEMEKEQITEANLHGLYSQIKMRGEAQAEQYYNETYGGNK